MTNTFVASQMGGATPRIMSRERPSLNPTTYALPLCRQEVIATPNDVRLAGWAA